MITTIGNRPRLITLLRQLQGRQLLGVVDGNTQVELVFDNHNGADNLLTIVTVGIGFGTVALGHIARPDTYLRNRRRTAMPETPTQPQPDEPNPQDPDEPEDEDQ